MNTMSHYHNVLLTTQRHQRGIFQYKMWNFFFTFNNVFVQLVVNYERVMHAEKQLVEFQCSDHHTHGEYKLNTRGWDGKKAVIEDSLSTEVLQLKWSQVTKWALQKWTLFSSAPFLLHPTFLLIALTASCQHNSIAELVYLQSFHSGDHIPAQYNLSMRMCFSLPLIK